MINENNKRTYVENKKENCFMIDSRLEKKEISVDDTSHSFISVFIATNFTVNLYLQLYISYYLFKIVKK